MLSPDTESDSMLGHDELLDYQYVRLVNHVNVDQDE